MSWPVTNLIFAFVQSAAAITLATGAPHVRTVDPWAMDSLERGMELSATVRALIRRLDTLNVVVHVESSVVMPSGIAGMTRLAHAAGNARYLRITVRRNVPPDVRASSLAHELQHAIEIALADVSTHVEMEQLYERIGHRR